MKKAKRYERALMIMTQGGTFSANEIADAMNYKAVYRMSAVVLDAKIYYGAVIKSKRSGRKVVGYELVNVKEMKDALAKRGFQTIITRDSKVKDLEELKTDPVVEESVVVDEMQITEVTEKEVA
jgi:hypothetical protein